MCFSVYYNVHTNKIITIMANYIDEMMGFNPSDMGAFQDKSPKSDPNIYKTNPKNSKTDDGEYHSKIRVLLNPLSPKDSIVSRSEYWLESMDGSRGVVSSLSIGDKQCPIFKAWKVGHFNEEKKAFYDSLFNKNESQWVLVQILEDDNQPELVGQFRMMKLAKDIYEKLSAKMNPSSASGKTPYPVMDYVIGLTLEMDVKPGPDDPAHPERKQREISYSVCDFGEYAPIIKTDGTQLFSEDELELIDSYVTAANDSQNGKTQKKKDEAAKKLAEIKPQIRPLYEKAINYVRENLKKVDGSELDLVKERGFQAWDENTRTFVERWIEMVHAGVNPKTTTYDAFLKQSSNTQVVNEVVPNTTTAAPTTNQSTNQTEEDDDLPF